MSEPITMGALGHYLRASELARAGKLRNDAPELQAISLSTEDSQKTVAFLQALNEDYR